MAHSDVVSEPSMEEILASIRRIIENNDQEVGVLKDVDGRSRDRNEDSCQKDGRSREGSLSYQLFSEGDSCLIDTEKEPISIRDSESLSLADVAARVRSETTRGDSSRIVSSDPSSNLMKEDQAVEPTEKHQLSSESSIGDKAIDADSLRDSSCSQRIYDSRDKKSIEETPISYKDQGKTDDFSILSPDVGSRVASSFDQLVVALRKADCRSLDQVSADILRPMLREWLDDNLPVMVERLVKEEIEKIARGTPRR